jgi:XTP/dITP diphosphohydrolase
MKKEFQFITSNRGKFVEARKKFEEAGLVLIQKKISYPELQADSLDEVVQFACKWLIWSGVKGIIEDTGLFIDSLSGFPGVYASWVLRTVGNEGILRLMEKINPDRRKAKFATVVGLVEGKDFRTFRGECMGRISEKARGERGFGFDPIFIPDGSEKVFAEMDVEEKNKFSHRSKAFDKLIEYIFRDD